MAKAVTIDESFAELLIAQRAALLAHVDAIEKFIGMPRTKELRAEVKRLKYEISKLNYEESVV